MILLDANVLLYAFRDDISPNHRDYHAYLDGLYRGNAAFGASAAVLAAVVRIATNSKAFKRPSPLEDALRFVLALKSSPAFTLVSPGGRHWDIFVDLCRSVDAKGNIVMDAYHAALALETNSEWITTDRDFARFPKLKWRHPLA